VARGDDATSAIDVDFFARNEARYANAG
jgi:hypothetical protein